MYRMYSTCTFWEWRIMYVGDRKGCNESAFSPPPPARGGDSWCMNPRSLAHSIHNQKYSLPDMTMIPLDLTTSTSIEIPPLASPTNFMSACLESAGSIGQLQHAWTGISVSDVFFSSITSCRWLGYGVSTAWGCCGPVDRNSKSCDVGLVEIQYLTPGHLLPTADRLLIEGVLLFVRGLDDHPHDEKICWHLWIDHIIIRT